MEKSSIFLRKKKKSEVSVTMMIWITLGVVSLVVGGVMLVKGPAWLKESVYPVQKSLSDGACLASGVANIVVVSKEQKLKEDQDGDGRKDTCDLCTCSCAELFNKDAAKRFETSCNPNKVGTSGADWDAIIAFYGDEEGCLTLHNKDKDGDGAPNGCDVDLFIVDEKPWLKRCNTQIEKLKKAGKSPRCNLMIT